uniref:NAD(P)H-dependent oxidoreductase subunit E n=1 Tax=candidate division WOR-3 bacterium TaxID=2052148 RepID=A0A7C4UA00_UNCW3
MERLKKIFSKYSENEKIGKEMLIEILHDINTEYNYIPENIAKYLSEVLNIPLSHIFHVVTFYTAFSMKPRGKHLIRVCMGTACHSRGSPKILDELERELGIKAGETTDDKEFTVETVNCLGTCALAPVITIDGDYHSVSASKLAKLIEKYRKGNAS